MAEEGIRVSWSLAEVLVEEKENIFQDPGLRYSQSPSKVKKSFKKHSRLWPKIIGGWVRDKVKKIYGRKVSFLLLDFCFWHIY
jgi:hypothetical protein